MKNAGTIYSLLCTTILSILDDNWIRVRVVETYLWHDDVEAPTVTVYAVLRDLVDAGYAEMKKATYCEMFKLSEELLGYIESAKVTNAETTVDSDFNPLAELFDAKVKYSDLSDDTKWVFELWCRMSEGKITHDAKESDYEFWFYGFTSLFSELTTEEEMVEEMGNEIRFSGCDFDVNRRKYWEDEDLLR